MNEENMTAEELLRKLMPCFRVSSFGIEWRFIEGTTIGDILGLEVEDALKEYLREESK